MGKYGPAQPLLSSDAPALGTRLDGAYELLRFLGCGGMGAVYEASAPDGSRVAVKVLVQSAMRGSGTQELLQRFKREANITAVLDNPHIVGLRDAGIDAESGIPYLVMPLLVGLDVADLIDSAGPLLPAVAVRLARQACSALQSAHELGVIHRDIKPANLFLEHTMGSVTLRILDFGIAKWLSDEAKLTQTGILLGTPVYMSPEQSRSVKAVDARADVWSLGVVLFEMLSGHIPLGEQGGGLVELLRAVRDAPIPHLQDLAPWVDPRLAAIVHGALIRDRDHRCPDAKALADALQPFAFGSDEVHEAMLTELPPDVAARAAERCALPTAWAESLAKPASSLAHTLPGMVSDPLLGKWIGGRYELLRSLGRGGMAVVYDARAETGDRFAIKIIDPDRSTHDAMLRRRFMREARAAMSVAHENVVRVYEADTDAQQALPYIVMELLRGMDLGALIESQGAIDPVTVARLFIQACRGLGAAHGCGLVHRDIKPANLFLHEVPAGRVVVKVCDFGIVKQLPGEGSHETAGGTLTRTGGVVGSPAFMSPEQARAAPTIDLRTDVWSLAVSLFHALAGSGPWAGRETVGDLIVAVCTEEIPSVRDRARWVPQGLSDVVHRGMRRDPDERFQSMSEFADALVPFADEGDEVRRDQLRPVPRSWREPAPGAVQQRLDADSQREMESARTQLDDSLHRLASDGLSEPSSRRSGRGLATWGALAAAALVAGVAAAFVFGSNTTGAAGPTASESPAASEGSSSGVRNPEAAAASPERARVRIAPQSATVTLDGKPQRVDGGVLLVEGRPGDRFEVVVEANGERTVQTVVITSGGTASPDAIALSEPGAESAPPHAAGRTGAPSGERPVAPSATTSPTAVTGSPLATSEPHSPTGPPTAEPKGFDEWDDPKEGAR